MKLVTIQVNGRLDYMVDFDKDSQNEVFVLEHTAGALPLLSFYPFQSNKNGRRTTRKNNAIFMFDESDKQIFLKSAIVSRRTPAEGDSSCSSNLEQFQLEITLTGKESSEANNTLADGFTFSWEEKGPIFKYEPSNSSIRLINVNVILEGEKGSEKNQSFKLYVGEQCNIADVTLDFGSEASQMAAFCRTNNLLIRDILPLFSNMRKTLGGSSGNEPPAKEGITEESPAEEGSTEDSPAKEGITEEPPAEKGTTEESPSKEGTTEARTLEENSSGNDNDEAFLQYDSSDPNLFKSCFFLKKKFTINEFNELRDIIEPTNSGILRMLCKEDEVNVLRESYLNVVNVKISGFGGVSVPMVSVDEDIVPMTEDDIVYRACLNTFLYQALKYVDAKNRRKRDGQKMHLLSLRMLMPNVYDHRKTYSTLQAAEAYIKNVIEARKFPSILAVELSAVSESDASLIGLIQATNTQSHPYQDGNYLILDAGKGTLDFSVIEYEKGKFSNRYRSGIIGSGNAITYAYVLAFVREFLKKIPDWPQTETKQESKIQEFIFSVILGNDNVGKGNEGGDSKHLLDLMKAVDDYKIRANSQNPNWGNRIPEHNQTSISSVRLSSFVTWIKNYQSELPADSQYYVNRMINKLVHDVCENLKAGLGNVIKVNYIAFTGRAFAMRRFRQAMEEALVDVFKRDKQKPKPITFLHGDEQFERMQLSLKNVCLYMYLALQNDSYNPRLMSEPFMLHSTQQTQAAPKEQNKEGKSNKSIVEKISDLLKKHTNEHEDPQSQVAAEAQLPPQDLPVVQSLGYKSRYRDVNQNQNMHRLGGEHNPFAYGFDLELKSVNDWLCVGGTLYNMQAVPLVNIGSFKLFYTGEFVSLFQDGKSIGVLPQRVDAIASNEFASLFPYVQVTNADKVVLPPKMDRSMESETTGQEGNDDRSQTDNVIVETNINDVINETNTYMDSK